MKKLYPILFLFLYSCINAQEIKLLACVGERFKVDDYKQHPSEAVKATVTLDEVNKRIKFNGIDCFTFSTIDKSPLLKFTPEENQKSCIGWLNAHFDETSIRFNANGFGNGYSADIQFNLNRIFSELNVTQKVMCLSKECGWNIISDKSTLACKKMEAQF